MNNGQQIQPNADLAKSREDQPFFTPGEEDAETNPDLKNSIENNTFNHENTSRGIGENAIKLNQDSKAPNLEDSAENTNLQSIEDEASLSTVINNDLAQNEINQETEAPVPKIEKNGLNDATFSEIRESEKKLEKGDAAGFTEDIIDIRIRLLNNTYGPNSKAKDLQRRVRKAA